MCTGVGIVVCWSCSDSACLQNQHFCLSWLSKDVQDATDFLASSISIAVALWNPTQARTVMLLEATQTNLSVRLILFPYSLKGSRMATHRMAALICKWQKKGETWLKEICLTTDSFCYLRTPASHQGFAGTVAEVANWLIRSVCNWCLSREVFLENSFSVSSLIT